MTGVPFVVIGGTGAPKRAGHFYYSPLRRVRPRGAIWTLKNYGLAHPLESALQIHAYNLTHFDEPVDLAGHSQGGIVANWLWLHFPEHYRCVVSLAQPSLGSGDCHTWYPVGSALRAMATESRLIVENGTKLSLQSPSRRARLTNIFSSHDWLVAPETAYISGYRNICIALESEHEALAQRFPGVQLVAGRVGHLAMPLVSTVHRLVDAALDLPVEDQRLAA